MRPLHVVIPVYERKEYLDYCLESVFQGKDENTRVIIYDDYSRTICWDDILRAYPELILCSSEHFGLRRNLGRAIDLSYTIDKSAIQFLVASDHILPKFYAEIIRGALVEIKDSGRERVDLGLFEHWPGPRFLQDRLRNKSKVYFDRDEVKAGIAFCGPYGICSMPSIILNPEATKEVAKKLLTVDSCSDVPSRDVQGLYSGYFIKRKCRLFAITHAIVEHVGSTPGDIKHMRIQTSELHPKFIFSEDHAAYYTGQNKLNRYLGSI